MTYLTIDSGKRDAFHMAKLNGDAYKTVETIFGTYIDRYLGDAPRCLPLAHILRCNSDLANVPGGYMRTSDTHAHDAGMTPTDMLDPQNSIYAWLKALNEDSLYLYTTYPSVFTDYNEDFWRCAYLRHQLGEASFAKLWLDAGITGAHAYDALTEHVVETRKSIITWPVRKLKTFVLYECEFTFQLAKLRGILRSKGPGRVPVTPLSF